MRIIPAEVTKVPVPTRFGLLHRFSLAKDLQTRVDLTFVKLELTMVFITKFPLDQRSDLRMVGFEAASL